MESFSDVQKRFPDSYIIRATVKYEGNLTSLETNPVLRFYTSGQTLPRTKYTEVTLGNDYRGEPFEVNVPLDLIHGTKKVYDVRGQFKLPKNSLENDTALWIQGYAQQVSSEGKALYEKDGSGMVYLNTMTEHTHQRTEKVPLILQSLALQGESPPEKGVVHVTLHNPIPSKAFLPVSLTDRIGINLQYTDALVRACVSTTMAPFDNQKASEIGLHQMSPTYEEMRHVMAPYYVSAAGVLPGPLYWSNMSQEEPWGEKIVLDTTRAVLDRNEISPGSFTTSLDEQLDSFEDMNFLTTAANILGQVVSAPSATVNYISDKRVTTGPFRSFPKERVVEDFGKLGPDKVESGGDCEDSGNFNGRMFVAVRDSHMTHPLTKSLQKLAKKYAAAGNLVTVTARNVTDSESHSAASITKEEEDKRMDAIYNPIGLRIGDPEDVNMRPGAHEFLQLIPKRTVYEWASRTSPSERDTMQWSDGSLMRDIPKEEGHLPLIDCEGTGMVKPLILPDEAYRGRKDQKLKAVEEQLKHLDAYTRIVTGKTYKEMYEGGTAMYDPSVFNTIGQFMRVNKNIVNDPDVLVSDFYRMSRSKFFIPEKSDPLYSKIFGKAKKDPVALVGEEAFSEVYDKTSFEKARNDKPDNASYVIGARSMDSEDIETGETSVLVNIGTRDSQSTTASSKESLVSIDIKTPEFYWLQSTPVQIGPRPRVYDQYEEEEGPNASGEHTVGVHTTDERNKRKFVGLARSPAPTNAQLSAIYAISKHLPPITPMEPVSAEQKKYWESEIIPNVEAILSNELRHKRRINTVKTKTIPYFIRMADYNPKAIQTIAKIAATNDHILAVTPHLEAYAKNMAMIRLGFTVDMSDWKGIKKDEISFKKMSRA